MAKSALPRIAVVSDMGHSLLKIGARGRDTEWVYADAPHAIHEIPGRKWEQAVERSSAATNAIDFIQIGGDYFIIGESAERYGHATRRMGAKRYERNYLGAQAMAMLARVTPETEAEVIVMALHPPADAEYRKELRRSLLGVWDMQLGNGQEYMFHVSKVIAVDEPVAGMMNVVLDNRLRERKEYTQADALVLDIGGGTTSVAPILPGGAVDYLRATSFPLGILSVTEKLQQGLMAHYRDMFLGTRQLRPSQLRAALMTERFEGGGRTLTCKDEVRSAKAELLSEVERIYFNGNLGGPLVFGSIILTGGGSIAMGEDLLDLLDHKRITFAHNKPEDIHFANAYGAAKWMDVFEAEGVYEL
jgi:hypothetical protein